MAPKFKKGDRVKAHATRFDKAETDLEEGEELFSAKWAADGNEIWCYGAVTRVYVKKGRHPQDYMIRYDNGESMRGMEEHLVAAEDDGESEIASEEERDNMDRDSDNCRIDLELDANIRAQRQDNDREVTDDEAGEVAEGEEAEMGAVTDIGETVIKGKDDDPNKNHGRESQLWVQVPGHKNGNPPLSKMYKYETTRQSSTFFWHCYLCPLKPCYKL